MNKDSFPMISGTLGIDAIECSSRKTTLVKMLTTQTRITNMAGLVFQKSCAGYRSNERRLTSQAGVWILMGGVLMAAPSAHGAAEEAPAVSAGFPSATEHFFVWALALRPNRRQQEILHDAIVAIKSTDEHAIKPNDVIVLIGAGPLGTGMEETYQVTSALKYIPWGKTVALVTDGRFSGVSTGACIGHVGPEALAGGPIGKIVDGDLIDIVLDRRDHPASADFHIVHPAAAAARRRQPGCRRRPK